MLQPLPLKLQVLPLLPSMLTASYTAQEHTVHHMDLSFESRLASFHLHEDVRNITRDARGGHPPKKTIGVNLVRHGTCNDCTVP